MNLLRRIASLPGLRAVLLHPWVRYLLASILALRFAIVARRTTTPWTFLWCEYVTARGQLRSYTIAATGVPVVLEHGRDIEALFELFERGEYEPPALVEERLAPSRVRRIVDIGANVGMFSAWANGRWPDATIVAIEPSTESAPVYRRWLEESRAPAELVIAAASTTAGTLAFEEGYGGGSRVAQPSTTTRRVPAIDTFSRLADADLVKIDIEGSEWPILADRRLAELHDVTLVMEYHRYQAPFLPAADAARELLRAAGFAVRLGHASYWGHGTLWAWKD